MARGLHYDLFVTTRRSDQQGERGFSLIELMAVVAIVGVLAVIGVVSYRKFILSSKTSEAVYMVGSIRSAEESYRAEALTYLDVSATFPTYYPAAAPGKFKTAWPDPNPAATGDAKAWGQLGVRSDSPVMYGYSVSAKAAGTAPPTLPTAQAFTWPNPTIEPWYVILAMGDLNADGVPSYVVGSSFTGEVYVENDGE
jgi:prepilin-type N-terminal cleavage/methylation domain-containing protein